MPAPRLSRLTASEFRSLRDVDVPLGSLTVLVGPNGSGKTSVLDALRFLATTVRVDLASAIDAWGGYERVKRQGTDRPRQRVSLGVAGQVTKNSSANALDEYKLIFGPTPTGGITRSESFQFKRTAGPGRRITISGSRVEIEDDGEAAQVQELASAQTTGLATLPRLADKKGGEGIRQLASFLSEIRVLRPNVESARRAGRLKPAPLREDASNLSAALLRLRDVDGDAFAALEADMRYCLPGLERIEFIEVGGSSSAIAIGLIESGLRRPIELADASFGTVRLLALFTALNEPKPPPFTAIEEVDHGLHPYALDVLVDRLRAASARTQVLVATHSPTLVNRLEPRELVVCDRDPDNGASLIPAADSRELARISEEADMPLGELWFAGAIAGVPEV